MKKKIAFMLTAVMMLSVMAPCALAYSSEETTPDEEFVLTTISSVSYIDENGKEVVEEEILSTEVVSADELGQISSDGISPYQLTPVHTRTGSFKNAITAVLKASFNYTAGISVSCATKSGNITYRESGWTTSPYLSVTQGSAGQWCRVTYVIPATSPSLVGYTFKLSLECSRSGVVI